MHLKSFVIWVSTAVPTPGCLSCRELLVASVTVPPKQFAAFPMTSVFLTSIFWSVSSLTSSDISGWSISAKLRKVLSLVVVEYSVSDSVKTVSEALKSSEELDPSCVNGDASESGLRRIELCDVDESSSKLFDWLVSQPGEVGGDFMCEFVRITLLLETYWFSRQSWESVKLELELASSWLSRIHVMSGWLTSPFVGVEVSGALKLQLAFFIISTGGSTQTSCNGWYWYKFFQSFSSHHVSQFLTSLPETLGFIYQCLCF